MASDGSIVIVADIDDKKAQAELNRLAKKIDDLNAKVKQAEDARFPLVERAEELGLQLDKAKAKLAEMQEAAKGTYTTDQIADQKETIKSLQAQWNAVQSQVERYDRAIAKATGDIEIAETRAGELAAGLSGAGTSGAQAGGEISEAMNSAASRVEKLGKRIMGLAKRVFVFSVITSGLRAMRTGLLNAVKANNDAAYAIGNLRGALLTLAQPILNVVIPALTWLANALTQVIGTIAAFVSILFGTTIEESTNAAESLWNQSAAIGGVGKAAKKAAKSLAAFDEINKLSTNEDAGGGGGGGAAEGILPDFSGIQDNISPILKGILADVLAIGVGLLAWKIASNFTGKIESLSEKLKILVGVAMIAAGVVMIAFNAIDAWNNGVDWSNLIGMVAGLALVMGGLALAIGPVAAGIAGIVGGLALLVIGTRDAIKNGMNWKNTLLMIAGILATGLGLSLITRSFIPAFIAAVAGALLALVMFTGHGDELMAGLTDVFEGFAKFFKGVFSGDMETAVEGLKQIWDGLKKAVKAIADSLKDAWNMFVDWFNEKTDGKFAPAIEAIETLFSDIFSGVKDILGGFIDFFAGFFTGDFDRSVEGLKKILRGLQTIFNSVIDFMTSAFDGFLTKFDEWTGGRFHDTIETIRTVVHGVVDAVKQILGGLIEFITGAFTGDWSKAWGGVKDIFKGIWNGVISILEGAINLIIKGLNWLIGKMNTISFEVPSWVPEVGGKKIGINIPAISEVKIPKLAAGAVIPPNREFLAVLGDQKQGMNVEAPAGLIAQIVRQELENAGIGRNGGRNQTIVLQLDRRELGRAVVDVYDLESQRVGLKLGGA